MIASTRGILATSATHVGLCVCLASCVQVPNPNFVGASGTGSETGDGDGDGTGLDGDGDATMSDGDGDGDPTGPGDGDGDSGDGDGDGDSGDGDGDGDTGSCDVGTENCPCTPLELCDDDLACVLGVCIDASSCQPVDDNVNVMVARTYAPLDPPPLPLTPETYVCSLAAVDGGNKATLIATQCNGGNDILESITMELAPKVSPIEDLFGVPLAATVTLVEADTGFYMRMNVGGMDIYYINGATRFYDGITMYPWSVEPFSSSCGTTPSMCGETERLAMLIDDGVVFDGNAGQPSDHATAWVETNLNVCGVNEYEFALIAY